MPARPGSDSVPGSGLGSGSVKDWDSAKYPGSEMGLGSGSARSLGRVMDWGSAKSLDPVKGSGSAMGQCP